VHRKPKTNARTVRMCVVTMPPRHRRESAASGVSGVPE
jgi:hypothetical protein